MVDRDSLKQRVTADVDRRRKELIELSLNIHANPEVAFEEHKSAAVLSEFLEANGFVVEREESAKYRRRFGQLPGQANRASPCSPSMTLFREWDTAVGTTLSGRLHARPGSL